MQKIQPATSMQCFFSQMPEFEDDHKTGEVAGGIGGRAVFRCVLDQLKLGI